jgi:hypothetical protein
MPAEGKTEIADSMARELETRLDGPIYYTPSRILSLIPRENFVYIFSLYPEELIVAKGSLGTFKIPACPVGHRVSEPIRLGTVVSSTYYDAMTNSMKTDDTEAKYVAQDIVRPFLGGDWSVGQNMEDFGVFWTYNEHPTDQEIEKARLKMEKMFRVQLGYASQLENKNQLQFISPAMRHADNYFKENHVWNRTHKRMDDCPGCGTPIKPGIIKHNCGYVFDVPLAVKTGMITREQGEELGYKAPAKEKSPDKPKTSGKNEKPEDGQ